MERYNFKSIEQKWQQHWEKNKTFSSKIDKNKINNYWSIEIQMADQGKHMKRMRMPSMLKTIWGDSSSELNRSQRFSTTSLPTVREFGSVLNHDIMNSQRDKNQR